MPAHSFLIEPHVCEAGSEPMSELYSHLHEDLQVRLDEAQRVAYGFSLPEALVVPIVPNWHQKIAKGKAA
jgi:hypothetical protein